MKILQFFSLALVLASFSGWSNAAQEISDSDFSGWLDDYDSLEFNEAKNSFVFFNEEARGKYDKVLLESVSVYSVNAKADKVMATKATDYLREGVLKVLADRDILATEAGPNVLRYSMAITGVEKSKAELKAHNLIPVSALFRGAQEVSGKVSTYIDAMFEAELVDSVTGARAAATVRKGIGETTKRSGDELTFEDVQPTLDLWLEQYGQTLDEFMAKR
ncbi:MAG: DUF3313 domain-containing protein [Halieaceae bacterium]